MLLHFNSRFSHFLSSSSHPHGMTISEGDSDDSDFNNTDDDTTTEDTDDDTDEDAVDTQQRFIPTDTNDKRLTTGT
jgi:hypothetical protein